MPNERSQEATSASRQKHVDEHQERIVSEKLEKEKVKTLEKLFEKIVKNSDLGGVYMEENLPGLIYIFSSRVDFLLQFI